MKKSIRMAFLAVFTLVCLTALFAVQTPYGAQADGLYSQNFQNYDGSTTADSWVWNNCGMVDDSPMGKEKLINDEYAIDGWSLKTGGNTAGTFSRGGLLAFQSNQLPNDGGKYWLKVDVRFVGVSAFGFEFLEANTDVVLSKATIEDTANVPAIGNGFKTEKHTDGKGDYYTVWFDLHGSAAEGRGTWGGFFATVTSDNGGYVVLDNISVVVNEDPVTMHSETFDNYTGGTAASYVWENSHLYCDAPDAKIEQAFDGNALVVRQTTAGRIADGTFIGLKGRGSDPTTVGNYYEVSFDMQTTAVKSFGINVMCVVPDAGDREQAKITVDVNKKSFEANCNAKVTFDGNIAHVAIQFQAIGTELFGGFFATVDDNAVLAFDNYRISQIKQLTLPLVKVSLSETFDNYTGGTAAAYVWENSHLYCDAPDAKIEQAFDGNALVVRQATAGRISDGTFIGLKGRGSDPTTMGNYYEVSFDMQTTNVATFGLNVKAVHPENGDIDQATITVNAANKTYTADCNAKVTFDGNVAHVAIQFQAIGTELFGGFFATLDDNAVLAFDNYKISSVEQLDLPFVVTQTDFESGELSPFNIETRYNSDNQFLGMLTSDGDKVINGALSVYAGFDASKLTDKWGKLLGLDFAFGAETYAVQFRYKVHTPAENYFYVQLGGSNDGKYVRFDADKIVECGNGVTAKIADNADGMAVLQVLFNADKAGKGLLIGSNGGGFVSLDDISVCKGENFAELPLLKREQLAQGTKIFEENFENQSVGDNLDVFRFTSGVDAFGYEYAYSAIDGKISLVMFNGGEWSEVVKTKQGLMKVGNVYTLLFRYKKLEDDVSDKQSNVNVLVNNGQTNVMYIAFDTNGQMRAYTTNGGGFWQGISLASVKQGNGCFEVSVTFVAPENARVVLGQYGSAKIALDNICLFQGFVGQFSSAATVVSAPDKNALLKTLDNAKSLDGAVYTASTFATLTEKINAAQSVYDNLDATAEQVDAALSALEQAIDGLVEKETEARQIFVQAVTEVTNAATQKDKFDKINAAIAAYKNVTDKAAVAEDYQRLQQAVTTYNGYVACVNDEVTASNQTAIDLSVACGGIATLLACVCVTIKRLLSGGAL